MFLAMLPFYATAAYRAVQPAEVAKGAPDWRLRAFSPVSYVVHLSRLFFVVHRVGSDPYLRQNLLPSWKEIPCASRSLRMRKNSKKKSGVEEDLYKGGTLNAFLNSSSNIDYVY